MEQIKYTNLTKAELVNKLHETEDKVVYMQNSFDKVHNQLISKVEQLDGYVADYNKLSSDHKNLEDMYNDLNVPEEDAVSKLTEEIDTLNSKIKRMASQNEELITANEELNEALTKANNMISFRTQEVNETKFLKERIASLDKTLGEVQEERDSLEEHLKVSQQRVSSFKEDIEKLDDYIKERDTFVVWLSDRLDEQAPRIEKLNQIEKQRKVMSKITITFLTMIALTIFFGVLGWLCKYAFGLIVGGHAIMGVLMSIVIFISVFWASTMITEAVIKEDD